MEVQDVTSRRNHHPDSGRICLRKTLLLRTSPRDRAPPFRVPGVVGLPAPHLDGSFVPQDDGGYDLAYTAHHTYDGRLPRPTEGATAHDPRAYELRHLHAP